MKNELVLGIDPGDTTGYCLVRIENRQIKSTGIVGHCKGTDTKKLQDIIEEADVVVLENFRVRPGKARQGVFNNSEMPTIQIIGRIKTLCEIQNKTLVLQEPAIKPAGYGFSNMKYSAKKHGVHWEDALAHAAYYCVTQGLCTPIGV